MERNRAIDITKGIAILSVMLGHTSGLPHCVYAVICSFHIPLFFIVSGYFAKPREELAVSGGGAYS